MTNNPLLCFLHTQSKRIPFAPLVAGAALGASRGTSVSADSFAFIIAATRAGGARRFGLSEVTGMSIGTSILKFERVFRREFRFPNRLVLGRNEGLPELCHPGNPQEWRPRRTTTTSRSLSLLRASAEDRRIATPSQFAVLSRPSPERSN